MVMKNLKRMALAAALGLVISVQGVMPVNAAEASVAAPMATVFSGHVHTWGEETVLDSHEIVVERNHECTICGYKCDLFQRVYKKKRICSGCGKIDIYEENSPTYSNHSCYN